MASLCHRRRRRRQYHHQVHCPNTSIMFCYRRRALLHAASTIATLPPSTSTIGTAAGASWFHSRSLWRSSSWSSQVRVLVERHFSLCRYCYHSSSSCHFAVCRMAKTKKRISKYMWEGRNEAERNGTRWAFFCGSDSWNEDVATFHEYPPNTVLMEKQNVTFWYKAMLNWIWWKPVIYPQ